MAQEADPSAPASTTAAPAETTATPRPATGEKAAETGTALVLTDADHNGVFGADEALKDMPGVPAGPGAATPPLSATVALARTGVSVLGIGLIGALLVVFGIGARTASRNREARPGGRA